MPIGLDRTDKALLSALQSNARLTVAELADSVSLTTSPCWRRVKILEDNAVIVGYQAILSPKALGFAFAASALLTFSYGFLENVGFPHISWLWVWPVMGVMWMVGLRLASHRYQ